MRLKTPRIAPLTDSEMGPDVKEMIAGRFGDAPVFNVFRTLARAPKAYKRFMGWGGYILSKYNDLSERDRELVILRAGYNWKSGYEWAQHKRIGLGCGLTEEEIVGALMRLAWVKMGPDGTPIPASWKAVRS